MGGLGEVRVGVGEFDLLRKSVGQSQFGVGRFRIQFERQAIVPFGFLDRSRLKLRLRQVISRAVLLGLLFRGAFEQRQSFRRILLPHEQDALVQLGLVQSRFELQRLAVFGDGFRVLAEKSIG